MLNSRIVVLMMIYDASLDISQDSITNALKSRNYVCPLGGPHFTAGTMMLKIDNLLAIVLIPVFVCCSCASGDPRVLKISDNPRAGVNAVLFLTPQLLATGSSTGEIKLWNVETLKLVSTFEGHGTTSVLQMSSVVDGKTFISTAMDRTVKLWNIGQLKPIGVLQGNAYPYAAFSKKAEQLAVADMSDINKLGTTIKFYSLPALKLIKQIDDEKHDELQDVFWSHDGKLICAVVASSHDADQPSGWIIWNVANGKQANFLKSEFGDPGVGEFSEDDSSLILPSQRAMIVYDVQNLKIKNSSMSLPCYQAVFLPGEKKFIAAGGNDSACIWSVEPLKFERLLTASLNFLPGAVSHAVAISQDGNLCAVGDSAGVVRIWQIKDIRDR